MQHLRSRRSIRRSLHATQKADQRGRIPNAVSISERPASVEDRAVPGHWEGDLLCGSRNSFIVSLVERHSRYVMLAKVPNRDTQTVVNALIRQARKLPDELYKSLTWDRGKELADHKRFTMETHIDVYFCDPQSPWQRGSNENTNRLLRQSFSARNRPRSTLASSTQHGGASAQRAAQKNTGLPLTSREIQRLCCGDRLRARSLAKPDEVVVSQAFAKRKDCHENKVPASAFVPRSDADSGGVSL